MKFNLPDLPPCDNKLLCDLGMVVHSSTYVAYLTPPNRNRTTSTVTCKTCDKEWIAKFDGYDTTYTEVKKYD